MTDKVLVENNIPQDESVETPVAENAPREHVKHFIPDDRVKKMTEKARLSGIEEGRKQMQEELQNQVQSHMQMPEGPRGPMVPQQPALDQSVVEQAIQRALEKQNQKILDAQQHENAARIAHERANLDAEYNRRIADELQKDPTAKEDLTTLNMKPFEHVKYLATLVTDNTGAVMRDLAKRKTFLAGLQALAERDHEAAAEELRLLSKSLKDKDMAIQNAALDTQDPLSKVTASTTGVDNGKRTIRDWKRDPRYKF